MMKKMIKEVFGEWILLMLMVEGIQTHHRKRRIFEKGGMGQ